MLFIDNILRIFSFAIFGAAFSISGMTQAQAQTASAPAAVAPALAVPAPASQVETIAATRPMLTGAARVNEESVTLALRKGVDYLLKVKKNNNWEADSYANQKIDAKNVRYGISALVVYALLHVGESLDDARLKARSEELAPAIKFVMDMKPETVYAASLQANVLALLPRKPDVVAAMEKCKERLIQSTRLDYGHAYYLNPNATGERGNSDSSNSQYGTLGLWAIQDSGGQVMQAYWQAAEKFWSTRATAEGGFPYLPNMGATYPMTTAGAATLLITDEFIDRGDKKSGPRPEKQLEDAFAYLGSRFSTNGLNGYTLYGLERVGLMSGRKFLGKVNWFTEGAGFLIDRQLGDGSWNLQELDSYKSVEVSTSFALLFLARGRNPVVFNKLMYGPNSAWHARPRDAANLMNWMRHQFERQINFQVVGIDTPVDDWLDAPVLLITGAKDPQFTDEQVEKLQHFVRQGGLIFSTADDNSAEFTAAMQKYAQRVAAGSDNYKWREIPKDHEVYQVYQKMPANSPQLFGIGNGLREFWLHSPKDFGAIWQSNQHPNSAEKSAGRIDKERPWELAANIFFYANGRGQMRSKLQSTAVPETMQMPIRSVRLGRLQWGGDWNYEPGAFDRLERLAKNFWRTELDIQPVGYRDLRDCKIAYMDGPGKFEIRAEDKNLLRNFVNKDGILVVNSPNSSTEFDKSFQALVRELFPNDTWAVIEDASALFAKDITLDMIDARETTTRLTTKMNADSQTKPKIYGLTDKKTGRLKIIYTPYDITLGLLGTTTCTFVGYSPESSEKLMRNILLYSYGVTEKKIR
jgi:hypothetical protein